jgi:hippurate hydrolase
MSFVLQEVPGAYLNISACPATSDPATAPDNHSPRAEFDDSVVPDIATFLAEIALRRSAALVREWRASTG